MPAKSEAQREVMAIAEHAPSKLYKKNQGLTKLTHQQLHDYAATKFAGSLSLVRSKGIKRVKDSDRDYK